MSYMLNFVVTFRNQPALTLNAQLYDASGTQTGATITSGFVNLGDGAYSYLATIPDGHVGALKVYDSTTLSRCVAFAINPQEAEYSNSKTSEVAQSTIAYSMPGGYTFYQMVIDLWAVLVGNSTANNATAPTSIEYEAPGGGVQVTHSLADTTRTLQ